MEYLSGGELFSYFRYASRFKRSTVRFYACQILLALEYLHSLSIVYRYAKTNESKYFPVSLCCSFGFVHRDLKLENLVLDKFGNLKLTDFGFAKYIQNR